jgi:demethylmenaquinone methyltransferase / 2-methoxy-6-polyprenyl-1,4-benzoquinol methylase
MTDARALFTGISHDYDRPASLLSFFQYRRWHRALVAQLGLKPDATVLDVATGTGLIARDIQETYHADVVGMDLTPAMLARSGLRYRVAADARAIPVPDATFDAVTFSYLFRYVDDVAATLGELVRVLKPGGVLGSVEFGVPPSPPLRALWKLYSLRMMPLLAKPFGKGWPEVGAFLGKSIVEWDAAWPLSKQLRVWDHAGIDVTRVLPRSFGAGVVLVGRKR